MPKCAPLLLVTILLVVGVPAWSHAQDPPQAPPPAEVNITGVWTMTVSSPQGEMVNDATFSQEKEALKVMMTGPQGMPLEGTGTVKEGGVQWAITFDTPNGAFTIVFVGKIDGDKMAGEIQMGDFGSAAWSATKKKT